MNLNLNIKRNLLFRFGTKNNVACQHSQQTRCWPNADPMMTHRLRCWPNIKLALVQCLVFAGLCSKAAGLVLLTAGGDYKPPPTQYLVNVGPASPVLASIHSVLISTSFWWYRHTGGTGTMLWTKAGLMLARHLWRWPTFSVAPSKTR